jgi:AraC family transcriptional regulator of adaptative response / DNA-3-methyladenine glycosylase II
MLPDAESLYRAVQSRDRRFQGRFVLGVTSTGIYCRPGCPARTPKRSNVRFFLSPAAAEVQGFRACLRCRPDAALAQAAAHGTGASVSRALRLISAGALEASGVDGLAAQLGLTSRHLRRLFDKHLGASPIEVAQTQRAHFARKLLEETALPMAQVALGSGYASLRRFNEAIRKSFGRTPTELRRAGSARAEGEGALVLKLPFRPPFDWDSLIAFLAPRAIPGVEEATPEAYRRTAVVDGKPALLEVRPEPGQSFLSLRLQSASPAGLLAPAGLLSTVERVRRLFDLEADPSRIGAHLEKDPALKPLVTARPGLRVPGAWDPFELSVRAILGQQVTVKGATTLAARLVERFGTPLPSPSGGLTHLFPPAARLASAELAGLGLPKARAGAIRALADATEDAARGLWAPAALEDAVERLCALPGIGPWTAQYIAMRALGEPDAFPEGDLGLRRALGVEAAELVARSERWRPWRAYAAMHLWMRGPEGSGEERS